MHGWSLVISPGAVLGSNVTVFHGVTLGRSETMGPDGVSIAEFPLIGDDVWIGAHAIITGGVKIGKGSRIAAGAFVARDVAPRTLIGGNPAVVLRDDCDPDVSNRAELPAL